MAIKRRNRVSASFSMSSMTDLVFLLLIFFMITSTVVTPSAIKLLLPKSSSQAAAKPITRVFIDEQVNFYVAKGFALKVGLQPGFLVNDNANGECKSFNFSIPVGLSYEFKNGITLDLRGGYSLTRVDKFDGNDLKYYTDGGSLTIGYKFELK